MNEEHEVREYSLSEIGVIDSFGVTLEHLSGEDAESLHSFLSREMGGGASSSPGSRVMEYNSRQNRLDVFFDVFHENVLYRERGKKVFRTRTLVFRK